VAVWAVIPAAGVGRRFGADVPKQYLAAAGRPLLAHVLDLFLAAPAVSAIVLATAPEDERWRDLLPASPSRPVVRAPGGGTRAGSVLAALDAVAGDAAPDDWALVHDAARPCLSRADLERLIDALSNDAVGGLLATPVVDTLKRSDDSDRVTGTAERGGLWRALTPQMFRFALLRDALREALAAGFEITDEASAMERAGHRPRLVAGGAENIKVTRPEDLALAEIILRGRE